MDVGKEELKSSAEIPEKTKDNETESDKDKEKEEKPVNKNLKKWQESESSAAMIVAKLRRDTPRGPNVFPQFRKTQGMAQSAQLAKKGPIKELRQQRLKSNSTSTLYVKNTISNPDDEEIVRCMSVALYYHILKGHESGTPFFLDVFSEKLFPLTNGYIDFDKPPEAESVYKFVSTIFHAEKLALECVILCLSYVEKVAEATGLTLHASNWRRVTLSSIILASKVWEEQAVWNVDFLSIFPNVTVRDLNKMEKKLLEALQYEVTLGAGMYAKYYFELRALSDLDENTFPLKPLDKHSAEKLEEKAQTQQKRIRKTTRRTLSMDSFHLLTTKSPLVILS